MSADEGILGHGAGYIAMNEDAQVRAESDREGKMGT